MHLVTPCECCHSRATGKGILPLKQGLVDIQAEVLNTHCSLFEYEGRGFLVSGNALTHYSFKDIMHLWGNIYFSNMHRVSHLQPFFCLYLNRHLDFKSIKSFLTRLYVTQHDLKPSSGNESSQEIAYHQCSCQVLSHQCVFCMCYAHCTTLRCVVLHRIALHCITLDCVALHCIASQCIASHCIALHCIAQTGRLSHQVALHNKPTTHWREAACSHALAVIVARVT